MSIELLYRTLVDVSVLCCGCQAEMKSNGEGADGGMKFVCPACRKVKVVVKLEVIKPEEN